MQCTMVRSRSSSEDLSFGGRELAAWRFARGGAPPLARPHACKHMDSSAVRNPSLPVSCEGSGKVGLSAVRSPCSLVSHTIEVMTQIFMMETYGN